MRRIIHEGNVSCKGGTVRSTTVRLPIQTLVGHSTDDVLECGISKVVCTHTEVIEVLDVVLHHEPLPILLARGHVEGKARIPVLDIPLGCHIDIRRERDIDIPSKAGVVVEDVALSAAKWHGCHAISPLCVSNAVRMSALVVDKQRIFMT